MSIFKKPKPRAAVTAAVQTARGNERTSLLSRRTLNYSEAKLYAALREAVPIIDAAINKIVRLMGTFSVICSDPSAEKALSRFLSEVPCGPVSRGINSFVTSVADRMLCYGTAVNELVFDGEGRLCALFGAELDTVCLSCGKNPLAPEITLRDGTLLAHPERVVVSALSPEGENPWGVSLLRGLPFVSETLMKIYNCVGVNFDRIGNLRFAVTYHPAAGEGGIGENRAEEIASAWSEAMRDTSAVRDFVAVGDVDIKIIGGESIMPDISVPVRTLLEQIVARVGLPPFLLGLSWSSTERMSAQQADILTSELEYYRSVITPLLTKICYAFLRGEGYFCDVQIEWSNITLQDELTLAQARLYNAQAEKIEKECGGENV